MCTGYTKKKCGSNFCPAVRASLLPGEVSLRKRGEKEIETFGRVPINRCNYARRPQRPFNTVQAAMMTENAGKIIPLSWESL